MKISKLNNMLDVLYKADISPMIVGHHGVGKSSTVREYAKSRDMEIVVIRLGNMVDAGDLLGLGDFTFNEKGEKIATKFFAPEWFPRDKNSKGIIFLDEINRIKSPSILQAVFGLAEPRFIGGRRLHTHILPEGWFVVGAANPPTEDYDVIDITDAAFNDRFCFLKIENSPEDHRDYMKRKEFNPALVSFCQEHETLMYPKFKDFDFNFIKPSNRSIEFVDKISKLTTDEETLKYLLMGTIGLEATVVYEKYMKDHFQMISVKDLIYDFKKVKPSILKVVKENRLDILNVLNDKLIDELKVNQYDDLSGVEQYLNAIPRDLKFGFVKLVVDKFSDNQILIKMINNVIKERI